MPVSSGTIMVGPTEFYLTWEAALADLAVLLLGNVTIIQTGPTSEVNTAKPPSGFDWNGFTLIMKTDGYRHTGLFINDGYLIDLTHSDHGFDFTDIAGGTEPLMDVEWLYIRRTGSPLSTIYDMLFDSDFGTWAGGTRKFSYLLFDGNTGFGQNGLGIIGSSGSQFQVHHCIGHDYSRFTYSFHSSGANIENCGASGTLATSHFEFSISSGGQVFNSYAFGASGADFSNQGSVDGFNNASGGTSADDTNWNSGADNIINVNAGTELISFDPTSVGYFRPQSNSILVGAGTSSSIGISRNLMDHPFPRVKNFTAPISSLTIHTIGPQQPSVLFTEDVESDDQILFSGGLFKVTGADIFEITEVADCIKALKVSGSDVMGMTEQGNVIGNYIVTGGDNMELLDAGINVPFFKCIPEVLLLRGRTNFWFPTDTMVNELTLPQPQPDDTYNLDTRVRTRHAKGGDLRVYKRGKVLHILNMNFVVDKNVRDLCLAFFELSSSQLVRLLDWEGRLWHGVITNTPIVFTAQGKSNQTERFTFSLEFEGIRQ